MPDSLALYKSSDFGKSWMPFQFYSSECKKIYGRLPNVEISKLNEQVESFKLVYYQKFKQMPGVRTQSDKFGSVSWTMAAGPEPLTQAAKPKPQKKSTKWKATTTVIFVKDERRERQAPRRVPEVR